jgi:hypothetical protein
MARSYSQPAARSASATVVRFLLADGISGIVD